MCLSASDGQDALRLWNASDRKIDLLLTDMVMPEGINGLQLAKQIRRDLPQIKVIVCSGYSAEITQSDKALLNDVVYIAKPYEAAVVGGTIRRCLDQKA